MLQETMGSLLIHISEGYLSCESVYSVLENCYN